VNKQDIPRIRTYHAERKTCYDDVAYEAEREQCERERAKANGSNGNGSVEPERFCWCRELIVNGKRQPVPLHHDCEYIRRRDALIPEAVRIANNHCSPIGKETGYKWTRTFVRALDRLAKPLLNQSDNGSA
jgi:hypothetical protein